MYTKSRKNKHLSLTERVKIELMLLEVKTAYAIAKALQRSINTILYEIRRGNVDQTKAGKIIRIYLTDAGQARYAENRQASRKPYQSLECEDFIHYIEEVMIQKRWSVDVAVGKARMDGRFRKTLSTRTLYHHIDLALLRIKNHHLPLKLRCKTKERVLRRNKKVLGNSIDHRPEHVNMREEFGHWEIDTVIGSKSSKDDVLLTLVERKTRNTLVGKISGKTAQAVMTELEQLIKEFENRYSINSFGALFFLLLIMFSPSRVWSILS